VGCRASAARGFTLIEILVTMVIIGVVISMATIAISVLGRDREIEDQAKRLWAVATQAREEAELQGRDLGLFIEDRGYLFMVYDQRHQEWQDVEDDDLLSRRELPAGLKFRLWLDGREVVLKPHQEHPRPKRDDKKKNEKLSLEDSIAKINLGFKNDKDKKKDQPEPQIALLSSGDATPFELRLEREGSPIEWHVISHPDNKMEVEEMQSGK
jgi:general secretion pathway protein H